MNDRPFIRKTNKPDPSLVMTGFGNRSDYQKSSTPNYRGRGPKGYKLIDERVYENVCEALFHEPQIDASGVEVSVQDGTVTLSGVAKDKETRQQIEDLAMDCVGVQHVYNKISIRPNTDPQGRIYTM